MAMSIGPQSFQIWVLILCFSITDYKTYVKTKVEIRVAILGFNPMTTPLQLNTLKPSSCAAANLFPVQLLSFTIFRYPVQSISVSIIEKIQLAFSTYHKCKAEYELCSRNLPKGFSVLVLIR